MVFVLLAPNLPTNRIAAAKVAINIVINAKVQQNVLNVKQVSI